MSDHCSQTLLIQNKRGLHARAANKFVKKVSEFSGTKVQVSKDGQTVIGTSIMGLLMLGAAINCNIDVEATGPQAEEAISAIAELVNDKFGED